MIANFRQLIQHNLAAKILAMLVACVLWVYVMNDQNPSIEGNFTVQVQLKNVPEGYKVTQGSNIVKLQVRGARSLFMSTNSEDFSAYVDLQDATSGKRSYRVEVALPQGFELMDAAPAAVEVTLDRIVQKQVRADINVNGTPAPGFTVAKVNLASQSVWIEGPESAVSEVERVIGYIGLTGKNDKDFDLQVPLTAINAEGREVQEISIQPEKLKVSIQMARGLLKKIVTITPVLGSDLPKEMEMAGVKADPVKIEIAGEDKVISAIDTLQTETIPLADVSKNTDKLVKLVLPEGVTVTNQDIVVHLSVREKKKTEE